MEGKSIIRAQHYYHHKNDISNQFTKIFFVIPLLFLPMLQSSYCALLVSCWLPLLWDGVYERRGEKMPCLILLLQNRPYYHDDYHDADPSYWRQDEEHSERLKLQIARKGKIQLGDERSSRIDYFTGRCNVTTKRPCKHPNTMHNKPFYYFSVLFFLLLL